MDRAGFPARTAVRGGISGAGGEPARARAAEGAHQGRRLAAPDARGGGALQGRRPGVADPHGPGAEESGGTLSKGRVVAGAIRKSRVKKVPLCEVKDDLSQLRAKPPSRR